MTLDEAQDEIARLGRCNEQLSHVHAVVRNELETTVTRLLQELVACREQLAEQTKSFCTHCNRMFPKGKAGLAAFREHIVECNQHPLHAMAVEIRELKATVASHVVATQPREG